MDTLIPTEPAGGCRRIQEGPEPPFYSRSYGGYSKAQIAFIQDVVKDRKTLRILDPMAGQAHYLSEWSWRAASVALGDINPALLLLASLRDPEILTLASELADWVKSRTRSLPHRIPTRLEYVDDWIQPELKEGLARYTEVLGLRGVSGQLTREPGCSEVSVEQRFAAALPILAARSLTTFTHSDNITWLKRGGLARPYGLAEALSDAATKWVSYATEAAKRIEPGIGGRLYLAKMNAEEGDFGNAGRPEIIITSPPYANRLDYTRMWAPELEVLAAMFEEVGPELIKISQMGSNTVRGKAISPEDTALLPSVVQEALEDIRADSDRHAGATYYYPFFLNYAVALAKCMRNLAQFLLPGGTIVLFIRDTATKDVLFPTGVLVEQVLCSIDGVYKVRTHRKLIKNHIGLRRRNRGANLYGLAQQEWHLVFGKRGA